MSLNYLQQLYIYFMEIITPKCISDRNCSEVCNFKSCKAIPFMCNNRECQCYQQHYSCFTTIPWQKLKLVLCNKQKSSPKIIECLNQIKKLYNTVLKRIESSYVYIHNIFSHDGISQLEKQILENIKEQNFGDLNGDLINRLEQELIIKENALQVRNTESEHQQILKQTDRLIKMLEDLTGLKPIMEQTLSLSNLYSTKSELSFTLQSKITEDIKTISIFFPNRKIRSINLLYRASDNNFQVSKFWDKCDGKSNTMIIIQTQYDKIIGGYTPLPWNKDFGGYTKDASKKSFIFSLTEKQKLTLIKGQQHKAIFQKNNLGPTFGFSDITINDHANKRVDNYAQIGYTYRNNEYYKNRDSWRKFSGQQDGSFKVQQWQVHEIIFQ